MNTPHLEEERADNQERNTLLLQDDQLAYDIQLLLWGDTWYNSEGHREK
ncbi:hypothetical protein H6770_05370 [Candidatus Peribacteria bacterium]|nr:hypothetical protein [Candidatus Peribacteria bacterium]